MNNQKGTIDIEPSFFTKTINNNEENKHEGNQIELKLTVSNNDNNPININFSSAQFDQRPDNLTNYLVRLPFYENLFEFPTQQTIQPHQSKEIQITLVPSKIKKYPTTPAVILQINGKATDTPIPSANFEYAIPIYLKNPEVQDKLEIEDFEPYKNIYITPNVDLKTTITNAGQVYNKPQGYVEIHEKKLLNNSKKRIKSLPLNQDSLILLPQKRLKKDISWQRDEFGHYEATLYIFSANSEPVTKTANFWILPSDFLIKAITSFILFVILLFGLIRARKKRLFKRLLNSIKGL